MLKLPLIEKLTTIRIGENDVAFGLLSLKHDLIIFVIILALFILSLMMREYLVSVSIRLISLLLIIFWALDILVLHFFTTRLSVADLKKFSGQWVAIETFVAQIFPDRPWLIFLVIAVTSILMILYVFTKANPAGKKTITTLTLITICLFAISLKPDPTSYVHPWTYQNVIEINMKQGITNKFSPELSAYLGRTPSPLEMRTNCVDGRNERPNVILLLFESLSMYHSQVFSGLPSLTPHFDRIARENSSYTNFFSNGFTTESALISLFTGKHMLPPTSGYATASWDSAYFYRGFHKPTDSLPRIFRRNGYHTGFITTGDLGFLNKGDWLHDIGFDFLEGAENPFYEGWPRLHFRAAPDEALYQRTLQILEELDQERPYFLTVETVSTHQPFYNPYTSERNEPGVFSMADKALGEFYDSLRSSNFFENGILVILGDHRSMTAIKPEEIDLYGPSAASRVPLVVVYGESRDPETVSALTQQTDFIPSFEYLISNRSCTGPLNGNIFAKPVVEASYVLFPRGDNRNLVDVYTSRGQDITIRLAGDDTGVVHGEMNDSEKIIHHINRERLRISKAEEILPAKQK